MYEVDHLRGKMLANSLLLPIFYLVALGSSGTTYCSAMCIINQGVSIVSTVVVASEAEEQLHRDLFHHQTYSKTVRPVANATDILTVKLKLKLAHIISVVRHKCHRLAWQIPSVLRSTKSYKS